MEPTLASSAKSRTKRQALRKPVAKLHHPQRQDSLREFNRLAELSSLTGATPPSGPMLDDLSIDREGIEASPWGYDEPIESLPELGREIGIADWIDPQTGEPAEGQSPPHLEAE